MKFEPLQAYVASLPQPFAFQLEPTGFSIWSCSAGQLKSLAALARTVLGETFAEPQPARSEAKRERSEIEEKAMTMRRTLDMRGLHWRCCTLERRRDARGRAKSEGHG